MNPFKNLSIKIICVILGIGFWIFSSFQLGRVGTFPADIDIKVTNVQPGLLPILSENRVKIRISAQPQVWQTLSSDSFQAQVDMAGKSEGIHQMAIRAISTHPQVHILKVAPDKIQVNLEKIADHRTPVELKLEGKPQDKYVVTGYQIDPETVVVKTAASIYKKITKVVAKVNVEGAEKNFSRACELTALDNQDNSLPQVNFDPQEVKVNVKIGRSGNVKTVGIRPNIVDDPQEGYLVKSISVNPAVLSIRGAASKIYATEYISTRPISIKDKNHDIETQVPLDLPSEITSLENIKKVTVAIKIRQAEITREIESANFNYQNLADNLKISSIFPVSVRLKIKGPIEIVNNAGGQDFKLNLNLASFQSVGNYEVTLKESDIQTPENTQLTDYIPQKFKIQLDKKL